MPHRFFWVLLLGWLSVAPGVPARAEEKREPCPGANTQVELNDCANAELEKADDELNRIYQKILAKYKGDVVFLGKFREAQRAWLKFRDAQFEARFPYAGTSRERSEYGSVFPMCAGLYKAELTRSRVEELRQWLDGVEEGDACSGSLPIKE
jgi:uncharacterized protein YecT (DUF1311 family)